MDWCSIAMVFSKGWLTIEPVPPVETLQSISEAFSMLSAFPAQNRLNFQSTVIVEKRASWWTVNPLSMGSLKSPHVPLESPWNPMWRIQASQNGLPWVLSFLWQTLMEKPSALWTIHKASRKHRFAFGGVLKCAFGGVLKWGATPPTHPFFVDFPWQKIPSIPWSSSKYLPQTMDFT